jgi:O-antigen ligase
MGVISSGLFSSFAAPLRLMVPTHAELLPYYDDVKGRRRLDIHLVLFGLNMLFVLVGYYFTIKFNALGAIKVFRIVLMAVSFAALLVQWRPARYQMNPLRHYILVAFILANCLMLPFSVVPMTSLERLLTVAPFWLYIDMFAYYVRGRYGPTDGLRRMEWFFLLVYLFPVITFFISVYPFAKLSIYGDDTAGFVSNQLGWSSAIVISCLLDVRSRLSSKKTWRILWFCGLAMSFWLLLISGSRSSYLSLAATLLVLLVVSKTLRFIPKILLSALILVAAFYFTTAKESAVTQRLTKTKAQLERVEPRLESARMAFHALNVQGYRYLTGLGYDVYQESIRTITRVQPRKAHNSYVELFVNTGVVIFSIFVLTLLLPAIIRYTKWDMGQFAFLPPILIIPYFENNLGAGQFIFYPWMFIPESSIEPTNMEIG